MLTSKNAHTLENHAPLFPRYLASIFNSTIMSAMISSAERMHSDVVELSDVAPIVDFEPEIERAVKSKDFGAEGGDEGRGGSAKEVTGNEVYSPLDDWENGPPGGGVGGVNSPPKIWEDGVFGDVCAVDGVLPKSNVLSPGVLPDDEEAKLKAGLGPKSEVGLAPKGDDCRGGRVENLNARFLGSR